MTIVREATARDGRRRVRIVHRDDGFFGFEVLRRADDPIESGWMPWGRFSECVAETAEIAEREARDRVDWLREGGLPFKPVLAVDDGRFATLEGFWDEVSRALIPGADWGRNLDAFNDVLSGGFGTPEDDFVLVWRASDLSRRRLGHPEMARQLESILARCHSSNRPTVAKRLAAARRGEGPTMCDWLLEIIAGHPYIELRLERR